VEPQGVCQALVSAVCIHAITNRRSPSLAFQFAQLHEGHFNRGRMIRKWGNLISRIERLLSRKQEDLDRSRLMWMYLNQANRSTGAGMRDGVGQERQERKFTQIRRRGR
jgi:hypothetical protein